MTSAEDYQWVKSQISNETTMKKDSRITSFYLVIFTFYIMDFLNEIFYNMLLKILIIEFFNIYINHLAQHPMNKSGTT